MFLGLRKKGEILSYYSGWFFWTFGAMMVRDTPIGPGVEGRSPVGLVTHVLLIGLEHVLAVFDPERYPVPGAPHQLDIGSLAVSRNANFFRLTFVPGLCQFGEADSESGYVISLEATMAGHDGELMAWQHANQQRRWLALIRMVDGQCLLLGNPETGLRHTFNRSSATNQGSKLTFSGKDWHPAWALPSIELSELFPDAAFDYSFNLSFDS